MTEPTATGRPPPASSRSSRGPPRHLPHLRSVRLRGTDDDRVIVRARDGGARRRDPDRRVPASSGSATGGQLEARPAPALDPPFADLDIDLPRTAAVALRTLSGDVEATGIAGDSRWASASGDIRLSVEAGRVQLETMSGDAVLEATGSITLGARTVSGGLRVRAPRLDGLDASTTSGDVRIEGDLAAGPPTTSTRCPATSSSSPPAPSASRSRRSRATSTRPAGTCRCGTRAARWSSATAPSPSPSGRPPATCGCGRWRAGPGRASPCRPAGARTGRPRRLSRRSRRSPRGGPGCPPRGRPRRSGPAPDRRGGGHAGLDWLRAGRRPPRGRPPGGPPGPRARRPRHRDRRARLEILEQAGPRYFRGWC